ncbi:MAG: SUMF1/EgtB/PvdO family nonheme iron enzyme, partial [Candidatus Poribacteria bacterium]|nr:SUMF1/EgtB/PvdO family nonheme iron enzyme [Candidatus Poribacteria bacterium]
MEGLQRTDGSENERPPPDMALIPAGEFEMGDRSVSANQNRCPVHTVYLDAFYIDQYPVTIERYRVFLEATGYRPPDWNRVAGYFPVKEQ